MSESSTDQRHFGMDWLRIFAFALLILYHIGMYFVPWPWHVNRLEPANWIAAPMVAMNSWRLLLLFLVSGYASAAIIKKQQPSYRFLRERTVRLMVPVGFAMLLIIPPQPWVELVTKSGYQQSLLHFWTSDYWSFSADWGMFLPTWQHLWFVCYLWAYTVLLTLLLVTLSSSSRQALSRLSDRLFGGWGVIGVPALLFILLVTIRGVDSVRLDTWVDGIAAHGVFFGSMLFGYYLYSAERGWAAIRRLWPVALVIAILAYATIMLIKIGWGAGDEPQWAKIGFAVARPVHGWATIIALIGIADRYGNRDGKWRAKLTEAVFPFYIVHQTIIVLVGFLLLPMLLPVGVELLIMVTTTAVGCWMFYQIGKTSPWLRPLIGLRR